ncbi:MAG: hypothetical protein JST38_07960 [Bacteroidetes bacterium]|nr:hypothetical protein [Bacteroidota bacterium]
MGRRGPDHRLTDELLASETGMAINRINEQQRQMRNGSVLFDPPSRRELKRAVKEIAMECTRSNWNGEGTAAVEQTTRDIALRFVDALPMGLPEPDPGVHPDGELSFSWIGAKGHRLTLAIGPTGRLTYTFRRLPRKLNGTEWMGDSIPDAILDHIRSFLPRA